MTGKDIAHYRIESLLGAGGMGEVYKARDNRLGRSVAVKMLPEVFARDPERIARLEREAKLLASLNHANIAALYGMEQADGRHFLIMELVEGDTLAERIQRGPIPVEEALRLARQIAEALEAAHERGVIHRDLKPANVKTTLEGNVKVLDFGLAKALEGSPAQVKSNSPTLLSAATNAGVILGTVGYMSPEQARGHEADQRSDIFSFGCVLYELLTGRPAFPGETATDILASIVAREADFSLLPSNLHPKMPDTIRRCLAKNPKDRWHAIADVRLELESIKADPRGLRLQIPRLSLWRRAIPFAITAAVVALIAAAATVAVVKTRPAAPAIVTRFSFVLPNGVRLSNAARHVLAISPDGAKLVHTGDGKLYIRTMGDMNARPIEGTNRDNATTPFFSPDNRWIGFWSGGKIQKIAITGGAAVTITDVENPWGASWGADNAIYVGQGEKGIVRVSADGGPPETIVQVKPGELAHGPQLLPGNEVVLFTLALAGSSDRWEKAQIVAQSLKTGERKIIMQGGRDARYARTGHLVYALRATLLVVPFDSKKLQVTGGPVPIVEGVEGSEQLSTGAAQFSLSENGSMAYVPADVLLRNDLVAVFDKLGSRLPLNIPASNYRQPRISPNGKQLAIDSSDGKEQIVWIYDLNGAAQVRRLTFEGNNTRPIWTPDGQRLVFSSIRDKESGLYWQRADGNGPAERLLSADSGQNLQAEAWLPEGKSLVFSTGGSGIRNLFMLTPSPAQRVEPLGSSSSNSSLSPDGKWLAYQSNASGRNEVFVRPIPVTEAKFQLTTEGGDNPLWSPDGKQIYYLVGAGTKRQMMFVDVRTQPTFTFEKPQQLPIKGLTGAGPRPYDITPDGKSFVAIIPKSQTEPDRAVQEQINVTLNWFEELKQRALEN